MTAAGSLNHLRLSVRHPAASAAFYDRLLSELGWTQIPRGDGGRAWERRDPIAGPQWLILTPVAPEHRDAPAHDLTAPGFHHLALNASDRRQVDRVHALLVEQGAEILDAPAEYDYNPRLPRGVLPRSRRLQARSGAHSLRRGSASGNVSAVLLVACTWWRSVYPAAVT